MLLAIDIGNTTISFGVVRHQKVLKYFDVPTNLPKKILKENLSKVFKNIDQHFPSLKKAVICSVVPNLTRVVQSLAEDCLEIKPVVIGEDLKVPIANHYRNPKQVGQDRLVCAYAVKVMYGHPAVVIDLGTAITFDIVSKKGAYEGGMIIPGIQLSADSLFQKTALLPRIDTIHGPKNLVGKTTKESILSGIFYGYGVMCTGLIELLSSQIQKKPYVVLTGGYTEIMKKYIFPKGYRIEKDLVFKGMELIFKTREV